MSIWGLGASEFLGLLVWPQILEPATEMLNLKAYTHWVTQSGFGHEPRVDPL